MKQVFQEKNQCYGCALCTNLCPVKAIEMTADDEGFLYPHIDENQCIDCGICVKNCPYTVETHYKNKEQPEYYVAKHSSKEVLLRSASGGAFTALSDVILEMGGVVYGADFDEDFTVRHQRADTVVKRDRLRTSKYVQSDITHIYESMQKDLEEGRTVLFTGTPCQNAGIKAYFESKNLAKNLHLCDLFCHSVPSPLIWKEFLNILTKKYGAVAAINFRSKNLPWSRPNCRQAFYFTTDSDGREHADNRFLRLFMEEGTIARPSCEVCQFTDTQRTGDITIGDYWGIEKYDTAWHDPLGVSLILASTPKGKELLDKCGGQLLYEQRPKEEALTEQPRLRRPGKFPPQRDEFWQDYKRHGLEYLLEKMK